MTLRLAVGHKVTPHLFQAPPPLHSRPALSPNSIIFFTYLLHLASPVYIFQNDLTNDKLNKLNKTKGAPGPWPSDQILIKWGSWKLAFLAYMSIGHVPVLCKCPCPPPCSASSLLCEVGP
jgi:hypothetical protein